MKLAIFSPAFMPVPAVRGGAIEQLTEDIIEANEQYHKYDIDLYTVNDPLLDRKKYKYTKIIKVDKVDNSIKYTMIRAINMLRKLLKKDRINFAELNMISKFKKNYYDSILVENNMNLYNRVLRKITREKIYFHLHNDFACGDLSKTKAKTEIIINTADEILVVSNFLKNKLQKMGATNVKVVPNLVISQKFKALPDEEKKRIKEKYGIKKNDFVFTFVGRMSKEKGIDKLLEAMNSFKNERNVKCLIVGNSFFDSGADEEYVQKLKNISEPIKEQIIFTGYINNDQLYKMYSITDCVVVPSQCEEAFGMAAFEAMIMKKAVIASDAGGLPEVLSKRGSILIQRNKQFTKKLSNAMEMLKDNPELSKKMGALNYKRTKSFPTTIDEYFSLITRIVV